MSPRTVDAALLAIARSPSAAEIIWLIEIPTGFAAPSTLRYTTCAYAVTWNGVVWSPLPAAPPSQTFDGPGTNTGRVLALGDVDATLSAYVEAGAKFEGQTVVIHQTDLSTTGGAGANAITSDEYTIESVTRGDGYLNFALRDIFGTFDVKVPRRLTTRAMFPGLAPGPLV